MVLGVDCSPQGVELSDGHFCSVGTFPGMLDNNCMMLFDINMVFF